MSSFTCLTYHLVFSTKHRQPFIDDSWQPRLFDYLGGILRQQGGALFAAGGMPDHVHLRDIKANSSKWIHGEIADQTGFAWQAGYGAFTASYSGVGAVRRYLAGQKEHHRGRTFQEEFLELLRRHEIEFDERYVWD
jgi:putative transposase